MICCVKIFSPIEITDVTLVEGKTAFDYYQQLESNQALKSNGSFVRTMQIL
jgi:hypothetical protein